MAGDLDQNDAFIITPSVELGDTYDSNWVGDDIDRLADWINDRGVNDDVKVKGSWRGKIEREDDR